MESVLNYDLSYYHCITAQSLEEYLIKFRNSFQATNNRCFATRFSVSISESFHNLLEIVSKAFSANNIQSQVMCYDSHTALVTNVSICFAVEDANYANYDLWKSYDRLITFRGFGDVVLLRAISDYLKAHLTESNVPTVVWQFLLDDEKQSQEIKIDQPKPIHDEFYPWIKEGVHPYFDRFLASDSSVLVLLGETGTAKTSFIRSLIWYASLNTMFTYEEKLLENDSLFVDFITNERTNLLVVEDADLFLTSREDDGNKIMSKFLNVGDGLAGLGKKKIIFTANIVDPTRIDSALLRAGRCFDCQVFRRLSFEEAMKAAQAAGVDLPTKAKDYTLAELFAKEKKPMFQQSRVGFVAG